MNGPYLTGHILEAGYLTGPPLYRSLEPLYLISLEALYRRL